VLTRVAARATDVQVRTAYIRGGRVDVDVDLNGDGDGDGDGDEKSPTQLRDHRHDARRELNRFLVSSFVEDLVRSRRRRRRRQRQRL